MIKELSSLRGIFILFIFLHHMSVFPGGGGMGVAFFFVLGGFAMTLGYHQKVMLPEFRYSSYLTKRMIKFYPLHWLCLLAVLPLCVDTFSWLTLPFNAALLHSWVPISDFYFSYNTVSWYLADTLFFAVVFPFLFKGIKSMNRPPKWIIVVLLVLVYIFLTILIPDNKRHAILYINPLVRLLDFIAGISAGLLLLNVKENRLIKNIVEKHSKFFNWFVFLLVGALIIQTVAESMIGIKTCPPLFWPLIMIIIIITSLLGVYQLSGSLISNKWLVLFGEYSFPFFMLHQIIIRYVYKFIRPSLCLLTDNNYILQVMLIIVCFVITLIATILIHNYINKPLTQWLTKKIQPSTTAR